MRGEEATHRPWPGCVSSARGGLEGAARQDSEAAEFGRYVYIAKGYGLLRQSGTMKADNTTQRHHFGSSASPRAEVGLDQHKGVRECRGLSLCRDTEVSDRPRIGNGPRVITSGNLSSVKARVNETRKALRVTHNIW